MFMNKSHEDTKKQQRRSRHDENNIEAAKKFVYLNIDLCFGWFWWWVSFVSNVWMYKEKRDWIT